MRILVSESDPALGMFLRRGFDAEHYAVDLTEDGEEAKSLAQRRNYDTAILDLNLPHGGDLDVLRSVRAARHELPILVLLNRTRPEDHARVFDLGADDLVLKPFAFSELSARVRALLRRARTADTVLCVEDLVLSRVEHSVQRAGRKIDLTPKEFALLEYLMRHAGQRVTRASIIENVWHTSGDNLTNVVDVYVNYLRKKVDASSERKLIQTARGVGYLVRGEAASSSTQT
jgi:two-component system, OmpR family, copper resistance phosphate regulon response regulator CusR